METLDDTEINDRLSDLPGWARQGHRIRREFSLADFVEAVQFVNAIVEPAEEAEHHPDLEVSWGSVVVNLTTHEADGLTHRDFDLARIITDLYDREFDHG